MNFLSIVIPCYNEYESLSALIKILSNLDNRINKLIIDEWLGWCIDLRMKVINLLFVSMILSSCSTRYQAEGLYDEGYEELQLAENMFRVSFRGNKYTRKQKVIDFQKGLDWFRQHNASAYMTLLD